MRKYTEAELSEAWEKLLSELYQLGPFTGGHMSCPNEGLVIQFHPLTPEIKQKALQKALEYFPDYPVEIVDRTVAAPLVLRRGS